MERAIDNSKALRALHKRHRLGAKDRRRSAGEKIAFGVAFVIFFIYALTILYAFFWIGMSSLKTNREFYRAPLALPEQWIFRNYIEAFTALEYNSVNMIGMIGNALWYALGSTFCHLLACCMTSYVFARYNFRLKKIMYSIVILTMIIPIIGGLAASYKLRYDLNLVNSPLILLPAFSGFGMHFIILMSYFKTLSWNYAEASFIDGGGHIKTFFSVMLPLAKAPIVALAIRCFINYWNDYYTPLLYLDKMPVLATGLYYYRLELTYRSNEPVYFAGVVMSMIPCLVLFAIFQDKIMENVTAGGLKG